jgi:hypothetical protein
MLSFSDELDKFTWKKLDSALKEIIMARNERSAKRFLTISQKIINTIFTNKINGKASPKKAGKVKSAGSIADEKAEITIKTAIRQFNVTRINFTMPLARFN